MDDQIRDLMLATTEEMLAAQLRAVRSLRARRPPRPSPRQAGMSQLEMAYAILRDAGQPMHVSELIAHIAERFGNAPDRESLVSALSKRVARADRFVRVGPNRFAVRSGSAGQQE